ncbi:MAG TPA: hypothetical protein VLB27_07820 [candidate division Zixibacteria bacterium]|nr:hypothetical protein [candidate division Zixibacteria bacterium]
MDANYIVLAVTLVIWVGFYLHLKRIDKRIDKLEGRS